MSAAAIQRKTSLSVRIKDEGRARVRFARPDGQTADKDREITLPNAIPEGARVAVSPWGHTSITDGELPAGVATMHSDGTADVEFFLKTRAGHDTFHTAKGLGPVAQMSYGFRVLEDGKPTEAQRAAGAVRVLKRLDVVELSMCIVGAGVDTGILSIKAGKDAPDMATVMAEYRRTQAYLKGLFPPPSSDELFRRQERLNAVARQIARKDGLGPAREARVDPSLHRQAVALTAWAAARTGITPPTVKWYSTDDVFAGDVLGMCDEKNHTIHLRADLRDWMLVRVICHEAGGHAARAARGLPDSEELATADEHDLLSLYLREVA